MLQCARQARDSPGRALTTVVVVRAFRACALMSSATHPYTRRSSESDLHLQLVRILFPAYVGDEAVSKAFLRDACVQGELRHLPPWVRTQAWKVFIGYLPTDKAAWYDYLCTKRNDYQVRTSCVAYDSDA